MAQNRIIGRLIESDARGYQFGCSDDTYQIPRMGDMVLAETQDGQIYGVICNIRWLSDDLVAQFSQAENIQTGIIKDNQLQRANGPFFDVKIVGYKSGGFFHTLPPRPPLSLGEISLPSLAEIADFTNASFAYLRLLFESRGEIPFCDVVAAHLYLSHIAHLDQGSPGWIKSAMRYLTDLLISDYDTLVSVSETVSQRVPDMHFLDRG